MSDPLREAASQAAESSGALDSARAPLEAHRPFVRRVHEQVQRVYAYTGLSAVVAAGLVWLVAWVAGQPLHPLTLLCSLCAALVGLWFARRATRRAQVTWRARVAQYCEANAIDPGALRDYYQGDDLYRFFTALYDQPDATPPAR